MAGTQYEYRPDSVSSPGETLQEALDTLGMSQAELALRMGRPKKTINEIIKGKTVITPETALQLELVLGIPASFWTESERLYRESLAREEHNESLAEQTHWLDNIPYKELIKLGWIKHRSDSTELLREVLAFFGVVSPEQWGALWSEKVGVAFRKSNAYAIDKTAMATWLRKVEIEGQKIVCEEYNEARFRQVLLEIRDLTRKTPSPELYHEELVNLCRSAGVAVVFIPRLSDSRAFGASEWLSPRKALIGLSLYFGRDDVLWFNFFHEAAHILLHSKKAVFINEEPAVESLHDANYVGEEKIEIEADRFAGDLLIPPIELDEFISSRSITSSGEPFFGKDEICIFASKIGVAPSIVVGRLHHEKILNPKFNRKLITHLDWDKHQQRIIIKRIAEAC